MNIEVEIRAIAADNTSGATELAARACDVLCAAARGAADTHEPMAGLWEAGESLLTAQPAMVSIINVVNAALVAAREAPPSEFHCAVQERLQALKAALLERPRAVAAAAVDLLPANAAVMTHSFSSVVLEWIVEACGRGRCAQVYCTESRPMSEGVTLARRLAAEGVPVTLIADAAVAQCLPRVQAVGVGADGITPEGLINKAGTHPLALAASCAHVPAYALCGSEKILGRHSIRPSLDHVRDPAELMPEPIEGVRVHNAYFEFTPLDLFTAVVTERGPMSRAGLRAMSDAVPVHEYLRMDR